MGNSTYLRSTTSRLPNYDDCPPLLRSFLRHIVTIEGASVRTANTYYLDLRLFLRYIKMLRDDIPREEFDEIPIKDIEEYDLKHVTREIIQEYLFFCAQNGDSINTRSVKLSSIKSFYNYLFTEIGFEENPASTVKRPKRPQRDPKYLTASESIRLLEASKTRKYPERDHCITTLFLHCGMRLSELVSLDVDSISENTLKIIGKGNKERTVYLNTTSLSALKSWLRVRAGYQNLIDKDALFVSNRTRKRLSNRGVQKIIEEELKAAGLGGQGFSTHKLRHTAATLLYEGGTDVLQLKEILGHEHVATTEIYTHLNNKQLKEATDNHPLNNPVSPEEEI